MSKMRAELHKDVVEALVSSKAIDFEAVGAVMSKYGARAALSGSPIGAIVNWRVIDICIPVDFRDLVHGVELERTAGAQVRG
jgi:hypothetical protein